MWTTSHGRCQVSFSLRIGHQALIKIVPQLTSDCKASHVSVPVGSGVV